MAVNQEEEGSKQRITGKITKRNILSFLAGIALALLLGVGLEAAVDPSFLQGTTAGNDTVVRYRMFAANASIPNVEQPDKYLGEVVIRYNPKINTTDSRSYLAADGQSLAIADNAALFSSIGASYGVDASYQNFKLPDFSKTELSDKTSYMIDVDGSYPMPGGKAATVNNGIAYVAASDAYDPENSASEFGYFTVDFGEIVLFRTTDPSLVSDHYIPCEGQLLTAKDYPDLSATVFANQKVFRVPDLSDSSPIAGTEYYICYNASYMDNK